MDELFEDVVSALQDDPRVLDLVGAALFATDGEVEATVELVMLRLRQCRPCDVDVLDALGRAGIVLAVAEEMAAIRARAEQAAGRSRDLLARSMAASRRAAAARSRSAAALAFVSASAIPSSSVMPTTSSSGGGSSRARRR
jgi:hypothetical protein